MLKNCFHKPLFLFVKIIQLIIYKNLHIQNKNTEVTRLDLRWYEVANVVNLFYNFSIRCYCNRSATFYVTKPFITPIIIVFCPGLVL